MSELRLIDVDPHDDATFDAWHAAWVAALNAALPGGYAHPMTLEEVRAFLQHPTSVVRSHAVAALVGDTVVGTGYLGLPLLDNLSSARLEATTTPGYERRGIGTAILRRVEEMAAAEGRTLLDSEVKWPSVLGPEGAGAPGIEFARKHGYRLVLSDVQRELPLPVADDVLDSLAASAAAKHADYELRTWVGPVPEEIVESWVQLSSGLVTEAPTGDREVEPTAPDVTAHRESEAQVERQGRTVHHAVAVAPDGDVVAYSELGTARHDPGVAYQWGTLVRPDHRGHRLGLAVKVAKLRLLQRTDPSIRTVVTWNAEVNAHMIAVNEALGFVPVARLGEVQKKVELG